MTVTNICIVKRLHFCSLEMWKHKKCERVTSWNKYSSIYARNSCYPSLICTLKEILVEKVAVQVIPCFSFLISLILLLNLRKIADVRCRKLKSWKLHVRLRPKKRWTLSVLNFEDMQLKVESAGTSSQQTSSRKDNEFYQLGNSCFEYKRYENCIYQAPRVPATNADDIFQPLKPTPATL